MVVDFHSHILPRIDDKRIGPLPENDAVRLVGTDWDYLM